MSMTDRMCTGEWCHGETLRVKTFLNFLSDGLMNGWVMPTGSLHRAGKCRTTAEIQQKHDGSGCGPVVGCVEPDSRWSS